MWVGCISIFGGSPLATFSSLFQLSIVLVIPERFDNLATTTFNQTMDPKKRKKGWYYTSRKDWVLFFHWVSKNLSNRNYRLGELINLYSFSGKIRQLGHKLLFKKYDSIFCHKIYGHFNVPLNWPHCKKNPESFEYL